MSELNALSNQLFRIYVDKNPKEPRGNRRCLPDIVIMRTGIGFFNRSESDINLAQPATIPYDRIKKAKFSKSELGSYYKIKVEGEIYLVSILAQRTNNCICIETVNPSIAHDPNKELFWHFTKFKKMNKALKAITEFMSPHFSTTRIIFIEEAIKLAAILDELSISKKTLKEEKQNGRL